MFPFPDRSDGKIFQFADGVVERSRINSNLTVVLKEEFMRKTKLLKILRYINMKLSHSGLSLIHI